MAIYVYTAGETNFDSMGICGALTPKRCEFSEKRNGLSQIVMEHPIDDFGRWAMLVAGCILKVDVPVRTTPEIDGTSLVTTVEKWKVKTTATSGQRKLYSKPSGGRVIKTLPVWADKAKTQRFEVTVVRKGANRYKAKTKYGSGWIPLSGLEYSVTDTIANDPAAIETVEPAWTIKPQFFRIREPKKTNKGVTVTASHIFYDMAGNITTYEPYSTAYPAWSSASAYTVGDMAARGGLNYFCIVAHTNHAPPNTTYWVDADSCFASLSKITGNCLIAHEFEGYTNLKDQRVGATWTRVKAVEALLAPNTGLVDRWGAELVRDNFEFYILREAGKNRGVRIEWKKNLLGIEYTTDITDVVARIMPIGKTYKGKPLFLAAGTYTVNGTTMTIGAGETWVTSPLAGDYAAPLMDTLNTDIKAKSGDASDVLNARLKMIEAVLNYFADTQCDQPSVNVRVDFVNLGKTIEYEQFKQLDDLYLCDRVRVRHPGIDVDVLTEVIGTVWDCLTGRFKSVELGRVQLDRTRIKMPVYQLPAGIPGSLVAPSTLGPGAVTDDFGTDVDMTGNESVQAIAQQYVKNAWITGEQVFKYAAGASTPTPASIIVSANLQNVLMGRWQYKNSGGSWVDYPTGDGNTTNTATSLVVKPGHAVWVNNVCTLQLLTDDANISDTFCLYKVSDGATGAAGTAAKVARISASAFVFKSTNGGVSYTPASIAMTPSFQSVTYSKWQYSTDGGNTFVDAVSGSNGITISGGVLTLANSSALFDADTTAVTFRLISSDAATTDSTTIHKLADGLSGLHVIVSNEAHTLPKTTGGVVTYTGSGTTLRVFEGATELIYDGVGTSNSRWKVTTTASGITRGTLTDSGDYLTVGDHSAMTGNTASIKYTVSGKRASGVAFSIDVYQSLSIAAQGDAGATGPQGIQGPAGADGAPTYTWIKYADTPTSGMSESPTNKVYMGIAYNKPTATESYAYSDYAWSLIKGTQGIQGPAGADGAPTYTWIKYATSAIGANMSDSPTGKTYIGLAYNKSTATESTTASDYTWALIQGPQGDAGADGLHGLTAILSNAAHTLPKTTDGTVTYTGSGTTMRLFEGATELSYDGTGLANGTYKVTTTAVGITCGALTDSGTYLTVGNHSDMVGNTASITFNISGKRANGTAFALSVIQTLSVAQQGATGANAVVFSIYAPNGSVFTNQTGTLTLQAAGYDGANQISSGATYVWKKYAGGSWVTISGATASTLTVSGSDVVGLQAYKCEMTYSGVVYSGTITLTDKTDNFQAGIQSTGGNTFRNGIGKSCLACRLWQNGVEFDTLKSTVMSETAPSSPSTGAYWYKITPTTPQVALMRWNGSIWQDVTTNPTYTHSKSYTWYRRDKDGNALDGGASFATGKVIYVDGDDVDQSTTWNCEVE